jgi:hypothetical protein
MKTSASKIVRSLVALTEATSDKSCAVFNDSRSFGRSIKVWGWDLHNYTNAVEWLESAGYKVQLVRTRSLKWGWSKGSALRLWIKKE